MNICAIIPALNEAKRIVPVIKGIIPFVDTVLVVDDGSSDATSEVSRAAGATILRHEQNAGKGQSLRDGLDWGCEQGFGSLLTLDADGQHLPAEAQGFVEARGKGADLVVGNRMTEIEEMPWLRKQTNLFMSWLISQVAGTHIPDSQCGYRLISAETWKAVRPLVTTVGFDFESEILISAARLGFHIEATKISTVYGDEVSKIRPVRDTLRFFSMIARKSITPRPKRIK